MNTNLHKSALLLMIATIAIVGCEDKTSPTWPEPAPKNIKQAAAKLKQEQRQSEPPTKVEQEKKEPESSKYTKADPPEEPPMKTSKVLYKEPPPQEGWKRSKELGKSIWLETKGEERRVLVAVAVCLREGPYGLECLLCRANTKEHESILVTNADASLIHFALEAAKIKAGAPVQYEPKFAPPRGDVVKITLMYEEKGKWVSVPAQKWIRQARTKKEFTHNWVFAGSRLHPNPEGEDKPPLYLANADGGYICISNVPTAMLDLPFDSPLGLEKRVYEPNTDSIPALDTSVTMILEPARK